MSKKIELTEAGLRLLQKELEDLKNQRPEIQQLLSDARAQGDLSENADYSAARERQARVEDRIKEIQDIIKHSIIISEQIDSESVGIGKEVIIKILNNNLEQKFTICGSIESNALEGRLSKDSPLGKAIYGKRKGSEVTYYVNNKELKAIIVDVL